MKKMELQIKEILSKDHLIYREFIKQGLLGDENRFRISPEDEDRSPFPTQDRDDSFTLGAFLNGDLGGVVSFTRDGADREKLRHKGLLFRMFVSSNFRGHGIGRKLVDEVIKKARSLGSIEQINLTVMADNDNAKKLYTSSGFETFGKERNAIKWKGNYFDEEQMSLFLK